LLESAKLHDKRNIYSEKQTGKLKLNIYVERKIHYILVRSLHQWSKHIKTSTFTKTKRIILNKNTETQNGG